MARSSHGPRQETTWAVAQNPRPTSRMVRLGRPANDNFHRPSLTTRLALVGVAVALALLAAINWPLI